MFDYLLVFLRVTNSYLSLYSMRVGHRGTGRSSRSQINVRILFSYLRESSPSLLFISLLHISFFCIRHNSPEVPLNHINVTCVDMDMDTDMDMYMCLFVHIHTYVYTHTYIHTYTHIHTHFHTDTLQPIFFI